MGVILLLKRPSSGPGNTQKKYEMKYPLRAEIIMSITIMTNAQTLEALLIAQRLIEK
jgi:hypothetical protein